MMLTALAVCVALTFAWAWLIARHVAALEHAVHTLTHRVETLERHGETGPALP